MELKRVAGALVGAAVGAAVVLAPVQGLDVQGSLVLGILACAVVWWVVGVFHETVTAFAMAIALAMVGIPADVVFQAFSGSTWWLLLAAFSLGLGMKESGLVARIASSVLSRFPNRFESQVFGLMAAGTVVGPFIPSMTAKLAVLEPLALGISDSLGYERKGRGASGLFLAALVGVRNNGPLFISASVVGYGLVALYPQEVQQQFDMLSWLLAALPWFIVVSVLTYATIVLLYRPKGQAAKVGESQAAKVGEAEAAEAPAMAAASAASIAPQAEPWTSKEKRMAAIILAAMAFWVSEPVHGISACVVALAALFACFACGIFTMKRFRSGLNWESLLFIGMVMGLSPVFVYTGVDTWVMGVVDPVVEALAFSPYALVLGIGVLTVLLRFVIVSEMAFVSIFMAFMVPLAPTLGVSPWVIGFAVYALVNPWFTLYQNPVYLAAFYSVDGQMVRHSSMAKYCLVYVAICLTALLVSVPYWQFLGFFSA